MELLIVGFIGALLGWSVAKYLYTNALAQLIESLNISEDQLRRAVHDLGIDIPDTKPETHTIEIDGEEYEYDSYVEVRIEESGGVLYAYDDDTDQFIAQDRDPNELIEFLTNHFPAKTRVNIDPNNGAEYLKKVVDNS